MRYACAFVTITRSGRGRERKNFLSLLTRKEKEKRDAEREKVTNIDTIFLQFASVSSTFISFSHSPNRTMTADLSPLPPTNKSLVGNHSESLFHLIAKLLNGSDLYKHQVAELIEPEKYSVTAVHFIIWTFTILTYLLAIPIVVRMVLSRSYVNPIDYFSAHIVFCAFVAWIPALILLLHQWFDVFTLRLCRFHYVILSTNETVGKPFASRPFAPDRCSFHF